MAKLLDRFAKKDEEIQEDSEKEEEMTKSSKYDLDLDKLKGKTETSQPWDAKPKTDRPFDTLKSKRTPLESITPPKRPIENCLDETWICYFENDVLEHRELKNCTSEEFGKWLSWIYPPSKAFLKKNMYLYEKFENREQEFRSIVKFLAALPKYFEKGSEQHTMHAPKKEEEK